MLIVQLSIEIAGKGLVVYMLCRRSETVVLLYLSFFISGLDLVDDASCGRLLSVRIHAWDSLEELDVCRPLTLIVG